MRGRLRTVGGYSLIALGLIGAVVPIMPTVPFLLGAAFMLGWEHPAIKPWVGYLEKMKFSRRPAAQTSDGKTPDAPPSER